MKRFVLLIVVGMLAVSLLLVSSPSAVVAGDPMPLNTWIILDEVMTAPAFFTGDWAWDGIPLVRFTITDLYVVSDEFEVYDNGVKIKTTPDVLDWDQLGLPDPHTSPPWTDDPDVALADGRFSSAVFYISSGGPHDITIKDIHIPPVSAGGLPFPDGTVAFKAESQSVLVDIKPGSCPNPINLKSKGVIPVAILGSDTFDVGMVDVSDGIRFAGALIVRSAYEDVNSDGFMDLVAFFNTGETLIRPGDTEAMIWGLLNNGIPFFGGDSIVTVPTM